MQRGSLPGSCSETRHTPPDRHIMQHAHKLRSSRTQSCCRLRRHRRSSSSLHPPPGGPRPPGATKGIKAGAQPLPAHAPSSGSRAARCPCTRSRNRSRASMPANQPVIRGCTRAARAGDADRATWRRRAGLQHHLELLLDDEELQTELDGRRTTPVARWERG